MAVWFQSNGSLSLENQSICDAVFTESTILQSKNYVQIQTNEMISENWCQMDRFCL